MSDNNNVSTKKQDINDDNQQEKLVPELRFPEFKDQILSLSEEMKKYEKEISEYDKKFEEARDGKKSEKEPKDTKTTEEHDEPEV